MISKLTKRNILVKANISMKEIPNDEVVIRKINHSDLDVFLISPDNVNLGQITDVLTFADVRLQIKEKQLEGYTFLVDGKTILIDKNGKLEFWPKGLFDTYREILIKLV